MTAIPPLVAQLSLAVLTVTVNLSNLLLSVANEWLRKGVVKEWSKA